MYGLIWKKLCGNETFIVWDAESHKFGDCFVNLCLVVVTHVLFGIFSSYNFSRHHSRLVQGAIPQSITLNLRFLLCLLLVILPVILLILHVTSDKTDIEIVTISSYVIQAGSWFLHSGFTWRLKRYFHIHIRGPVMVVLSFLGTTVAVTFHLYSVIVDVRSKKGYVQTAEDYGSYIKSAFHLVYLLTLLPSHRPGATLLHSTGSINYTDSEREPLLRRRQDTEQIQSSLGKAASDSYCLSKLFFLWANPLMLKGYRRNISGTDDLFSLPAELETEFIDEKFKKSLALVRGSSEDQEKQSSISKSDDHHQQQRHTGTRPSDLYSINFANPSTFEHQRVNNSTHVPKPAKNSLLKALSKSFGFECFLLGVLKFFGDGLNFAGPILLNYLVSYMENSKEPVWHGYIYAAGLFLSTFLSSMFSIHFGYMISVLGLKVRAALITSVYKKALSVSSVALSCFTTGQVVNYMSTDTDRIVNFAPSLHQFWSLPIQVAVSLYLLYSQVGLAFLAGLGFAIMLIPINRWLAVKIGKLSTAMMQQKDDRVKVMNEILFGVRVIKFYHWEAHFREKVSRLRALELRSLRGRKYLDALCVFFWATTPVLISILTFTTYALLGHQLTAAKVFTSIAVFNILITPLNAFPWVINGLVESWVSLKRLQKYLILRDTNLKEYYTPMPDQNGHAVVIDRGTFTWSCERDKRGQSKEEDTQEAENSLQLTDINVCIPQGKVTGIAGSVGSGKSSFLHALLAEMNRVSGRIAVSCSTEGFGLVSQEAWIQHATVRDNILFGRPFDQEKYEAVVHACALTDDLKILPAGDQTEIGENGVTLSGGQKARVSLARAVYQEKAVYLLDDPFAAVDAHVANHLFKHCIMGLLLGKTVILSTHHVNFLQDAEQVLVLKDGRVIAQGAPSEVLSSVEFEDKKKNKKKKRGASESEEVEEGGDEGQNTEQCALVEEEEKDTGVVKFAIYASYWRAVGRCLSPLILLSLFLMQGSKNVSDWWLSYWVNHSHRGQENVTQLAHSTTSSEEGVQYTNESVPWTPLVYGDDNTTFYLIVYGGLAASNVLFALIRAFSFAYGGLCAATKIHIELLTSILKAPVRFFDVTPIGRILNRFSSDMYAVDDSLPFILNIFLAQLYGLLGTLVVTSVGLPWFLVLLLPLAIIYYFVQFCQYWKGEIDFYHYVAARRFQGDMYSEDVQASHQRHLRYYRHTSREVKRITSVTLSPIYAHFSETVTGLVTIRAHREQARFESVNKSLLEENQRAQLSSSIASTWLSIRLQMMGVVMVTGVAFVAVLEHHFQTVNPGLVGLAISYALSVTGLMSGMVQYFTETEKEMVSVERAAQYIETVPWEPQDSLFQTPDIWPNEGSILYKSVKLQYRAGLPFALDGVSFHVRGGEKVGIVGRTGSGKSSLFLSLFRMVEVHTGEIEIDGVNIAHLDLSELRTKMAVIPQDPFLFSGSVRENLDPRAAHSDREVWACLERCHMASVVRVMGGLEVELQEKGRSFSLGQRQLLCMGRALLTNAKILCIDEATASVDRETDSRLQEILRTEFGSHTVLTIAHRVATVRHSDRVIVMDAGRVREFDTPDKLMEDTNSLYYSLVNSTK